MKEYLERLQSIHFNWNINKYDGKERDRLVTEVLNDYADAKFKNLDLHNVVGRSEQLPTNDDVVNAVKKQLNDNGYRTE